MEKQKGLFKKLLAIRKSMPKFEKDEAGYNYKYVSGAQVLEKFREAADFQEVLLFTGITGKMEIIPTVIHTEKTNTKTGEIIKSQKIEYCVNAPMVMMFIDAETGDRFDIPFAGAGAQDDPSQAEGSMLTYIERYFLMKTNNVPTDDVDPDKVKSELKRQEEKPKDNPLQNLQAKINMTLKVKFADADISDVDKLGVFHVLYGKAVDRPVTDYEKKSIKSACDIGNDKILNALLPLVEAYKL
jgi:hypothetical protein